MTVARQKSTSPYRTKVVALASPKHTKKTGSPVKTLKLEKLKCVSHYEKAGLTVDMVEL